MNGRFACAIIAFAVATAIVSHASVLPEFFVQLHDPNLLGAPLYAMLLQHFGYAFVLALSAVLTGAAVLLSGWRTRTRGASDWHAALAALLAALCLIGSLGVSLAPIGWLCAASFCLLLDRDDDASAVNALAVVAVWSLLQGGATIGAVIALLTLAGSLIDARSFTVTVRRKAIVAGGACMLGALQLHALPWQAYGPHALFLDSLANGAQRDRIWSSGLSSASVGFAALVIVAGWYGVRRRGNSSDAIVFFGLLLLSLVDARNLPYFGIAGAAIAADALASYYVGARTFPAGTVRQHLVTFAAAAAVFIATLTASEPKVSRWPAASGQPASLFAALDADGRAHRVLCTKPRWCDGTQAALLDDRAGIAGAAARKVQYDVVTSSGSWRRELRNAGVDAVIAGKEDDLAALLASGGWHTAASDGEHVLLRPEGAQ